MTIIKFLGYVVAFLITATIVGIGFAFIETDGQLAVIAITMTAVTLVMGITSIYMRSQRCTKAEMQKHVGYSSHVFQHISPLEQKLLQLSIILAVSMIILGIIEKGPKVIFMIQEFLKSTG